MILQIFNELIKTIIYFESSTIQMIQIKLSRRLHLNSHRKIEIKSKIKFRSSENIEYDVDNNDSSEKYLYETLK